MPKVVCHLNYKSVSRFPGNISYTIDNQSDRVLEFYDFLAVSTPWHPAAYSYMLTNSASVFYSPPRSLKLLKQYKHVIIYLILSVHLEIFKNMPFVYNPIYLDHNHLKRTDRLCSGN